MSDNHASSATTTLDASLSAGNNRDAVTAEGSKPGYFRRYRLPLTLAVVAICLYATSILYILFGKGQVV